MGLYADDYWNLLEAKKHDGFSYFANHMTHINSRYTYALVNRVMYLLFFDPQNVFGWVYIRLAGIFVLLLHFVGVFFVYKSLVRLRAPKTALLVLLPFLSFPVYGHQALMCLGAAYAYPVGFALLSTAVYALLCGHSILFAVLMFFALGATAFVVLPGFTIAGRVWLLRPGTPKEESFFFQETSVERFFLTFPIYRLGLAGGTDPRGNLQNRKNSCPPQVVRDAP